MITPNNHMKARRIAFAVDKGGVGKTTVAINTAAGLASRGYRVLAVDSDQQANLTTTFLGRIPKKTLLDSLLDPTIPLERIKIKENLDLVPATHGMFGIGIRLISDMLSSRHITPENDCRFILRRLFQPLTSEYDFILIDCPPSDNIMMMNALYAADYILIVANPEPFCVEGVQNYILMMKTVRKSVNLSLTLAGILINDYETGSIGHSKAEAALRQLAHKYVFETRIRHSRPLYNAILAHQDIFSYASDSIGAQDYAKYIDELIIRIKQYE